MDKPHIEKEYKVMISEDKYLSLIKELNVTSFRQTNYYYDTHDKTCALRIREISGKYIFTLKVKGEDFKYEYEFEISNNSLEHKEVKEVLDKFKISDPKYMGYMVTDRSTMNMKYGELCIDKSIYNNHVDYELEYELFDYEVDKYDDFLELLNKYNIEFVISKKSKLKRFKDSLGEKI